MDLARLGFEVDTGGLRKGQTELKGLAGQSDRTSQRVSNLGRTIRSLAGALAVGAAFRTVIRNTIEQERVTAQLEQTLRSTGRFTETLSMGLQDYASELQNVTTYGDEAIISSQALLLTFTRIGEEAFPRAQEAVLDVATAMGTDLKSAAIQVGKALNDPVVGLTALSRSGITFSETQKEMIKDMVEAGDAAGAQAAILDELETQFGGSARAARNTLGGALQSLSNAFGDLLEGDSSGGGVTGTTEAINDLTDLLSSSEVKQAFGTLTEGIINLTGVVTEGIVAFVDFGKAIGTTFAEIVHGTNDVGVKLAELWNEEYELVERNNKLKEDGFKKYGRTANEYRKNQERILEIERERAQLESLRDLMSVGGSSGDGDGGVNIGIPMPNVPRVEGGDDAPPGEDDEAQKIREQMERRRQALLESLETERHAILRAYGERNAEIQELEQVAIGEGGITQMQAAQLRVENERMKQEQLTELTRAGEERRREEEERSAAQRVQIQERLNMQILGQASGFASNMAGVVRQFAGEQSSLYKAAFVAQQGFAIASAIINTELAAVSALAPPPIGLGPVAGLPYAATIRGFGYASAAMIGVQSLGELASFDGGGYTGNGSRTGGMDGKGGFLAMMHPRETVIDHTKGGDSSSNSTNVTQVFQLSDNARREAKQQILESAPMIQQMAKQAVLQAINQGGAMSRAVGRRS